MPSVTTCAGATTRQSPVFGDGRLATRGAWGRGPAVSIAGSGDPTLSWHQGVQRKSVDVDVDVLGWLACNRLRVVGVH